MDIKKGILEGHKIRDIILDESPKMYGSENPEVWDKIVSKFPKGSDVNKVELRAYMNKLNDEYSIDVDIDDDLVNSVLSQLKGDD